MMEMRKALFICCLIIAVGDLSLAKKRTKRQFSFGFGPFQLGSFGGGNNNNNNNDDGGRQDNNPLNPILGFVSQFVRPPNQGGNQGGQNNNPGGGNNNQGGNNNNQRPPGNVLGNVNIGGIPIQVTSQNGGFGISLGNGCPNNGGCEQGCRMIRGRPRCFCRNGFLLRQDGRTCQDFDECQQGNNGGCSEVCNNTPGSFTCSCRQGQLQPDQKTCSGPPPPGPGPQFQGCNVNNGGCQQLCIQNGPQAQCGCTPGFSLDRDGKSCRPVDLCVENNGGCEDICTTQGSSVECSCFPGRRLRRNKKQCRDINECRNNNGGCQQICKNTQGSFRCECQDGFTLVGNGQCQADQQQTPAPPVVTQPPQTPPPVIVQPTVGPNEGCGINNKKSLFRRIVGGSKADPKDWPWMAVFLTRAQNNQYCGGTLITNQHVLTAAHCMVVYSTSQFFVRLGEYDFATNVGDSPSDYNVIALRIHERYDRNTQENDIAIVKLDRTVVFSDFIRPACLPPADRSFAGSPGYVIGFGTIDEGGPVSSVLQEVIVPAWQPDECNAAYPGKIFPGMMCAGSKTGGKDSCQGDSGGPWQTQLINNRRWYVVGVVSWGIGCARPEKPGVYTEVAKYLQWITSNAI